MLYYMIVYIPRLWDGQSIFLPVSQAAAAKQSLEDFKSQMAQVQRFVFFFFAGQGVRREGLKSAGDFFNVFKLHIVSTIW